KLEIDIQSSKEYVAPRDEIEKQLVDLFEEVLGVERVGINDNFFELGGDSIISIQVVARAKNVGLNIQVKDLFESGNVKELTKRVNKSTIHRLCEQEEVKGESFLNPIQTQFLNSNSRDLNHFNQSVLFDIDKTINIKTIEKLFAMIIQQHDILRARFNKNSILYTQKSNISIMEEESRKNITEICDKHQKSLNIENGPIGKVILIKTDDKYAKNRLFLLLHHLVVDGVSWRILIADFLMLFNAYKAGQPLTLGLKTTSYKDYVRVLKETTEESLFEDDLKYWENVVNQKVATVSRKVDESEALKLLTKNVSLNKQLTQQLLTKVNQAYNTKINDILLSVLVMALEQYTKKSDFLILLEGHGRDEIDERIDSTRSVGWFTSLYPLILNTKGKDEESIKCIKEQIRAVPNNGISYGWLKYYHKDEEVRNSLSIKDHKGIVFNYLGQSDNIINEDDSSILTPSSENTGEDFALGYDEMKNINLNCIISDLEFKASFSCTNELYDEEALEEISTLFIQKLESIIRLLRDKDGLVAYTPSDFSYCKLTQNELDNSIVSNNMGNIEDIYTLSSMQEGMLFHTLYDSSDLAYKEQMVCQFKNTIDIDRFEKSFQYIVDKHSVLRSVFLHKEVSVPHQLVYKSQKIPFSYKDITHLSKEEQDDIITQSIKIAQTKEVKFEEYSLIALKLFKCQENNYHFIFTHHHILLDGWSLPIIFKELFEVYNDLGKGQELFFEKDNYSDYIQYINSYDKNKGKEYWSNYLAGFEEVNKLHIEQNVLDRSDAKGKHQEKKILLSKGETKVLSEFTKKHKITMNTLVQAAWSFILSIYSQSEDVVFGVVHSGRPPSLDNIEQKVGLYINTIPLRVKFNQNDLIREWLISLHKDQIDMNNYLYSSINEIAQYANLNTPEKLFNTILVYENYPVDEALKENNKSELIIDNFQIEEQTNYALTLLSDYHEEQLTINLSYDEKYYRGKDIQVMIIQMQNVLNDLVSKNRIKEIELLNKEQREELIVGYNQTEVEYPRDRTIHSLFEEQVRKNPDK
ncbi:MAG: hypothetical protein GY932_07485, partial [Arcobacter sp.]|nr:hypothetical protein [Arcobacter sp.]